MATKKTASKARKTAKRATAVGKPAARSASAQKVTDVLKLLCSGLANAGNALAKLRDAQTDASLREALNKEITSLNSSRMLAEDALSKGVGEGVVSVGK